MDTYQRMYVNVPICFCRVSFSWNLVDYKQLVSFVFEILRFVSSDFEITYFFTFYERCNLRITWKNF